MIAQGGIITLLGMAVVFAFLGILVGALRILGLFSLRAGPSTGEADPRRRAAAIAAAYAAGRGRGEQNG